MNVGFISTKYNVSYIRILKEILAICYFLWIYRTLPLLLTDTKFTLNACVTSRVSSLTLKERSVFRAFCLRWRRVWDCAVASSGVIVAHVAVVRFFWLIHATQNKHKEVT